MLDRSGGPYGSSGAPQSPYRQGGAPGGLDRLLAGRSRADKEADQDAIQRLLIFGGLVVGAVIFVIWGFFRLLGLRLGIWSLPVFAPLWAWAFVSCIVKEPLRPVAMVRLAGWRRLALVGLLLFLVWLVWPLWADPAAAAWHAAHGGFGPFLTRPNYPLAAIIAASPFAMGLVAGLLLVFGMLATPGFRRREPPAEGPPSGPVPLRSALVSGELDRGQ